MSTPSVILVGVDFGAPHFDAPLEELGLLAQTAGYSVADRVTCKRRAPDPALFVGDSAYGRAYYLVTVAGNDGVVLLAGGQDLGERINRLKTRISGLVPER